MAGNLIILNRQNESKMQQKKILIFAVTLFCLGLTGLNAQTVKDAEGNIYVTISIGKQVWTAENLKTTKFNDSKPIPLVPDEKAWKALKTPAYCWFNNELKNKDVSGALYNWYTVNTGKLCPQGWHVPADEEWTVLTDFLGGKSIAGGKLKETGTSHWLTPNTEATNETGFTGLPSGYRNFGGGFNSITKYGFWWSSTEWSSTAAWYRDVYYGYTAVDRSNSNKRSGANVRCLKD